MPRPGPSFSLLLLSGILRSPRVWPPPAVPPHSSPSILGMQSENLFLDSVSGFGQCPGGLWPKFSLSPVTFLGLGPMNTHAAAPQRSARGSSCPAPVPWCSPGHTPCFLNPPTTYLLIPQCRLFFCPLGGKEKVGLARLWFFFFRDGLELTLGSVLPLRQPPSSLKVRFAK